MALLPVLLETLLVSNPVQNAWSLGRELGEECPADN